MAKIEFVRKFIKARDNFGEALTKSGQQYIKTIDPDGDQDDDPAEMVEDESAAMEKGVDGVAPRVIKALKTYEKRADELEEEAKDYAKNNSGSKTPAPPLEQNTSHFKEASKDAKKWLTNMIRAINDSVVKSDLAAADSSGRIARVGRDFANTCDGLLSELNKQSATILKTAAKDAEPPDLPPSNFQGEFCKIFKDNKIAMDTDAFVREIKETETRFKKVDGNRVYAKFQGLCRPALDSLEDLIKDIKKFDPKKSKGDSDDDLKPEKLKKLAKDLEAFAKKVDEYDDRIFLFSKL